MNIVFGYGRVGIRDAFSVLYTLFFLIKQKWFQNNCDNTLDYVFHFCLLTSKKIYEMMPNFQC